MGSIDRCYEIARVAKSLDAYITTGSDAHFCLDIGGLSLASQLIDEVGINPQRVITHTARQFLDFLELRGRQPIEEFAGLL